MKAVKEINFLSHIFQKTVFHRERTVFWIWMSSGLIYAIVKLLIGKYNNYKIFENVFPHVINGLHLYVGRCVKILTFFFMPKAPTFTSWGFVIT